MKKTISILFILMIFQPLFSTDVVRTISVYGNGVMSIKPDTVVISTGVNSGDPIIGVALEENSLIMSQIFEGLADLGISIDDVETSNYNVYLYTPYQNDKNKQEEYRVTNSIKINIKNLNLVDAVIDTIITLGANKIDGIYFTFENKDKYQDILRKEAMKDARKKAELLADLEKMKIKSVISISEDIDSKDNNVNYAYAMSEMSKSSITSGMETLSIKYNVTYEIEAK